MATELWLKIFSGILLGIIVLIALAAVCTKFWKTWVYDIKEYVTEQSNAFCYRVKSKLPGGRTTRINVRPEGTNIKDSGESPASKV